MANEAVRSMNATAAADALEDCKRRVKWFPRLRLEVVRHISHLKNRKAALEKRLKAPSAVRSEMRLRPDTARNRRASIL